MTPTSSGRSTIHEDMGLTDVWNRTLVYFGIAEDEEWDEDGAVTNEDLEREYRSRSRHNVRKLPRRRERAGWTDDSLSDADSEPVTALPARRARLREAPREREAREPRETRESRESRPARERSRSRDRDRAQVSVHLVVPRSFNDAQQIADKFKDDVPVILNLQTADNELSKRLIDFASGLTYALEGSMQRVADKVFLLTPRNVELSAEERAKALDRGSGGFFNQA